MLNNIKNISLIAALLVSSSAMASVTTIGHFGASNGVIDTGTTFNEFDVTLGGVNINVSAWSDTGNIPGEDTSVVGDNKIERAIDMDPNGKGWSIQNADEQKSDGSKLSYCGYSHSSDNYGNDCNYQDYDFFLLDFSESVTLNAAGFSWATDDNAAINQVSVAALNSGDIAGKTWTDVGSTSQTIASGYAQLQGDKDFYYTYFGDSNKNKVGNVANASSRYWLIGALNAAVFGGKTSWEGNDGMKLSHIKFTRNSTLAATSVPEPSSIALFGLAIVGLFASSRKKLK